MSKIIGIDLGTTNSAVAIIESGQPKIIEKFSLKNKQSSIETNRFRNHMIYYV